MRAEAPAHGATEVFLSYAREDVEVAQALAATLDADGYRVWWDRRLAGGADFAVEIERELAAARVVLVLWSPSSAQSGFVRDECTRARDAGKLLPVRIDEVTLPLGFGSLHTFDLIGWSGDAHDDACVRLRDEVRRKLAAPSTGRLGLLGGEGLEGRGTARPSLAWRRWRTPAALLIGSALIAGAAWIVLASKDDTQAQAQVHLERGLAAQFDTEPNLEVARNAYLAALRGWPDFAPAHFYLAHVYAQLRLPDDARQHFQASLAKADQLDPAQRKDARTQLQAIVALLSEKAPGSANQVAKAAAPAEVAAERRAAERRTAERATADRSAADRVLAEAKTEALKRTSPVVSAPGAEPAIAPVPKAGLVRTAPDAALLQTVAAQADALLANDRQAQVSAATTLSLDGALAADALPKVLSATVGALSQAPEAKATREAVAQSLRLLQQASPSVLRALSSDAQRVVAAGRHFGGTSASAADEVQNRLSQADAAKPVVLIHIADERQRLLARDLAARLAAMGYSTPGIENVGGARAPARTEIRSHGASDPALARWLAQHLARTIEQPVPVQALRLARAKTDTYEIWFGGPLCAQPGRVVAACRQPQDKE